MTRQPRGITLIELLVTLAIVLILTMMAAPSMRALLMNTRITTMTNSFVAAFAYARGEAIKRGTSHTTVCARTLPVADDGEQCSMLGDWQDGGLVFDDKDGDAFIAPGETLKRVIKTDANNGIIVSGDAIAVTYHPDGTASGLILCLTDTTHTATPRRVSVLQSGAQYLTQQENCQ